MATALSEDFQETVLSVASSGVTVALRVAEPPSVRDSSVLSRLTPVTATVAAVTVTLQVAVLLPSLVVTVMVAEPALTAVTLPFSSTVATALSEDFQETVLSVASSGVTVALRVAEPPSVRDSSVLSRLTPVTATVAASTVMEQVAVLPPSLVLTVMVALPGLPARTSPLSTATTAASLVVQVTVLSVASSGVTVAVRVAFSPDFRVSSVLSRLTPVTATSPLSTVTLQVAVLPPSLVLTVMVAVPGLPARISPLSTATTGGSLDVQVTLLSVAFAGVTVAVRVAFSPDFRVSSVLSRLMPVTATVLALTVMVTVAVNPPSLVLTVMVAVPGATAVTIPVLDTVATEVSLEEKETSGVVASLGWTV